MALLNYFLLLPFCDGASIAINDGKSAQGVPCNKYYKFNFRKNILFSECLIELSNTHVYSA